MIPVIDLSPILGSYDKIKDGEYEKVFKSLGDAMSGVGFAYLINHGVDLDKVEKVYERSREFFALPQELKLQYKKVNPPENFHGYSSPGDELVNETEKNSTELREAWDVWGPSQYKEEAYPKELPHFKGAFDQLRPELNNVSKKLLKCLAKYLMLEDEDFFAKCHRNLGDPEVKTQTQMRTIWYYTLNPHDNIPPNAIRCGEHKDWGSITLLFQDEVGGLEVKNVAGEWIEAKPLKGAILLNAGQLMEFWTGGHVHAAFHRVRIITQGLPAKKPRQSFIYFVNPDGETEVSPIVPLRKGAEHFKERPSLIAFDHYKRLITDATTKGY